jgi:hypothetical protein
MVYANKKKVGYKNKVESILLESKARTYSCYFLDILCPLYKGGDIRIVVLISF